MYVSLWTREWVGGSSVALTAATAPSSWALRIRDFYDCCFGSCCYRYCCCCCRQACFLLRSTFVRLLSVFVSCLFASTSHLPHHREYKYKNKHTTARTQANNCKYKYTLSILLIFFCYIDMCVGMFIGMWQHLLLA